MAKTDPQVRSAPRRKRKSKAKSQVSYSFVLLSLMLVVGCISGLVAFVFGQQALQGVNPIPQGGKLPRQAVPTDKPSQKANTNSFWDSDRKAFTLARKYELHSKANNNGALMNLVHPTNVKHLGKNSSADLNINDEIQRLSIRHSLRQNDRLLAKPFNLTQLEVSSDFNMRMDVSIAHQARSLMVSR
jgi:hypothetical protein